MYIFSCQTINFFAAIQYSRIPGTYYSSINFHSLIDATILYQASYYLVGNKVTQRGNLFQNGPLKALTIWFNFKGYKLIIQFTVAHWSFFLQTMARRECFGMCKVCRVFFSSNMPVSIGKTPSHKTSTNKLHDLWVQKFQLPLAIVSVTKISFTGDQ